MARHLHIDPFNGVAGDMLLASLVDLGAPAGAIEHALRQIPFPGVSALSLSFPEVSSHGINGRRLQIALEPGGRLPRQGYTELRKLLCDAPAGDRARGLALAALERIGRAEAQAHRVPLDDVHFHELGGLDTLIDLLGVALAVEALEIETITCGPIPLSRGKIQCEHGLLPSPAPATLTLLTGIPVKGLDVDGEVVTPTGAALAVTLADSFGPAPAFALQAVGAGFGRSEFPGRPNCLRLFLGDRATPAGEPDFLTVLEANLDDLSPEIVATLPDLCVATGARDAWLSAVLMKKGRPGHVLHALCDAGTWPRIQEVIFRHSTTLGVRRWNVEREVLERSWETVDTAWGSVRVKIGWLGGKIVNRAPEFEDCRRVAEGSGVSLKEVYAAAVAAARNG